MEKILNLLGSLPFKTYLYSHSALDLYFGPPDVPVVRAAFEGSVSDLAAEIESLRFPGRPFTDAVNRCGETIVTWKTLDSIGEITSHPADQLNLLYDVGGRRFLDPNGIYYSLRKKTIDGIDEELAVPMNGNKLERAEYCWKVIGDIAVLLSRYGYDLPSEKKVSCGLPGKDLESALMPVDAQRELLLLVLTGKNPQRGFEFLKNTRFLEYHWPELVSLDMVDHSKEYHPEGNVWEHTLETFGYRKSKDIPVSLALLLHDMGKPMAEEAEGRRFDRHAQIGGREAGRFLRRLGFSPSLKEDVVFLVENHMLPAYIPKLPPRVVERALSSPLFPRLLEVYRCDLSSTFRGPEGYYEACKAYRKYLKNKKNPFRDANGKKMMRLYVEKVSSK